ncbi:MAG TPA: restriction endonuclease subunit S [candidate division Zixibacteria bacterium]|nr:restriction endonuclease subunit S [candidate division Zixibacteria bacterium]
MTRASAKSLAEIAEFVQYGYTASASEHHVGPRFLRITDIVPSQIDWDSVPYCEIDEKARNKFSLATGDIVIARTGATVGYAKLIRNNPESVFASYLVRIRVDRQIADPGYVGRIVESDVYKQFVLSQVGGAAQPNANAKILSSFRLPIPDRSTQSRIVEILSAYDDLIENNRRRIQLLEQSARLLYKEWFVHLRFPGHEHTQIINGVPEGWEKKPLREIADVTMGQSPKSIYYNNDGNGLPFHQGVTNFGVRFPKHETYCTVQSRIAEPGDILFSVRAPVGRINITPDKIVIGRGLAAIRSICDHQNYLFYALKSHFFKEDMIGGGAIFAAITKKDLYGVELIKPTDRIAAMFMEHVVPIDLQIANLHQTIERLTKARDLLLPKLMNGEVAV